MRNTAKTHRLLWTEIESHDDMQPMTGPTWAEIQTQAARLSEWTAILGEAIKHRRFPLRYYAWLDKYGFKYDEFEDGSG